MSSDGTEVAAVAVLWECVIDDSVVDLVVVKERSVVVTETFWPVAEVTEVPFWLSLMLSPAIAWSSCNSNSLAAAAGTPLQ